jgi:hypothetical protein
MEKRPYSDITYKSFHKTVGVSTATNTTKCADYDLEKKAKSKIAAQGRR